MSQVITNAFEQYWQSSLAAEQPVVLDEFILADIPNLDITSPIDPDTGLPPESQIVHRQNVDQRGRINNNAVAYTIVMDTTVGDFSFNAMYLRNKQNGVIGMIVYKGRETKLKTDQTTGQTGNSLVKSMLMGYDQAAEATLTNVDAGTWQIDYAARLRGQDEDLRKLTCQLYGHHTFIGDGFKVVQQDSGYQVTQGVAIVGGLRIELKQPEIIYPGTKPIGVWLDVHRSGSLLSEHQNHFTIITSVADLADHVDSNGYQHFVAKLGSIPHSGVVADDRVQVSTEYDFNYIFDFIKKLQSESGAGLVGGLPVYVNAEKYAGGASTSSANNDAAISAAITEALATGNYVYWPEVYEVKFNIPNFHKVRHDGPGGVKREGDTFLVHPLEWHTNTMYSSPSSVEANDGLTARVPFNGIQAAFDAIQNNWASQFCFGKWIVKLAAGTYKEKNKFSKPLSNNNRFEVLGPDVSFGNPKAIVDGALLPSDSVGMYFQGLRRVKVQDVWFKNFRGDNGQGLTAEGRVDMYTVNVHATECGWCGLNQSVQGQLRVEGGRFANNRTGIRCYSGVTYTIGYNGSENRTILESNSAAGFLAQNNSAGHVDDVDVINNSAGVYLVNQSRAHLLRTVIRGNNIGVIAESSSTYIKNYVIFTENTRDELTKAFSIPEEFVNEFTFTPATKALAFGLGRAGVNPSSGYEYSFSLSEGGAGIQLLSPDGKVISYTFGSPKNPTAGRLSYDLSTDTMRFVTAGQNRLFLSATGLMPLPDNSMRLGSPSNNRFTEVCAVNGAINTSDAREKSIPNGISDALMDAADELDIVLFQWLSSIEEKGEEKARWHFGAIAQEVRDTFIKHGVDGTRYGLLCYDEWKDVYEPVIETWVEEVWLENPKNGEKVKEVITHERHTGEMKLVNPAGDRWGLRPDECHWLMHAAAKRRNKLLSARISNLERRLEAAGL